MIFPSYFHEIETIKLYDPLSDILGSARDGILEFGFQDAVRFAGHGCPTVGGAYLMTLHGLRILYDKQIPTRGMIEIHMNRPKDHGTTGVVASVAGSILGASDEGGFKGLGGYFYRNNLIKFSQEFSGNIKLVRYDTNQSVILEYHPEIIPGNQKTGILLERIIKGEASNDEKEEFSHLWNTRLKDLMLFNCPTTMGLITVSSSLTS